MLSLRHQSSSPKLRHQAWLITHARNLENLIGWICPFDRSSWLSLSILSGFVVPSKRSIDLVYLCRLALWKKESFLLLLVPDEAYLGPNRVILDELYVCSKRSKGLESGKDTWREAPHNMALKRVYMEVRKMLLFVQVLLWLTQKVILCLTLLLQYQDLSFKNYDFDIKS